MLAGFFVSSLNTVLLVIIGWGLLDIRVRVKQIESYYQHNKKRVIEGIAEAAQ